MICTIAYQNSDIDKTEYNYFDEEAIKLKYKNTTWRQ